MLESELERCHFHPERAAVDECSICHLFLCADCLTSRESLSLCPTHNHLDPKDFILSKSVLSTPSDFEAGVKLYELQQELYNLKKVVSYIAVAYIEAEGQIQTQTSLYIHKDASCT